MRKKRQLTIEEIKTVEGMASLGLPMIKIAQILGTSEETFIRMVKADTALRDSMNRGRAKVSSNIYKSLYDMATKKGNQQFQALKWWTQSQEGFKSADRLEITGPEGGPIEVKKLNRAERLALIHKMNEKLKLTEDEA